jgi:23S rRNA (cytidine1920-2'-O)/16S rRNA (cytidine1409-2'-O)-methyltransferase
MVKKPPNTKATVMERLLGEGFFDSKAAALPYLMRGAVFCGAERVRTGGQKVPLSASLSVRGLAERYVSKGGYKLEGAIRDFGIPVEGRVCVDAGACTGGFTDCLIQHGAEKVYAVEAGFGQLVGSLRQNPRVVNLEKTNLGDERLLGLDPVPTLGSADLSYLSLIKAVPQFKAVMHGQGELICLVKPLFEIENPDARRTGAIPPSEYAPLLGRVAGELSRQEGTTVCGLTHSHVTGNHGTHEFFLHVRFGEELGPGGGQKALPQKSWLAEATEAARRALELPKYEK